MGVSGLRTNSNKPTLKGGDKEGEVQIPCQDSSLIPPIVARACAMGYVKLQMPGIADMD